MDFKNWFADSPYASYLRALVAIVIAQAVTQFSVAGHFDFSSWQSWLIAALVATLPTLTRLLNGADPLDPAGLLPR